MIASHGKTLFRTLFKVGEQALTFDHIIDAELVMQTDQVVAIKATFLLDPNQLATVLTAMHEVVTEPTGGDGPKF